MKLSDRIAHMMHQNGFIRLEVISFISEKCDELIGEYLEQQLTNYIQWLAERNDPDFATRLNTADIERYLKEVKNMKI